MERAIGVVTDVKDLGELLSGAMVDQARLSPSAGRLRLELELTRAMPERTTVVRRGLFSRATTPWIKSRLVLEQIQQVGIQRLTETSVEQSPLLVCDAVPGGYTLTVTSPDGLRLSVSLEQLSGRFSDVGQPIESP